MIFVAPNSQGKASPEIVYLTKSNGPLTKRICLDENGMLHSDGSTCVMSHGSARRASITSIRQLGELIGDLRSDQAIALGSLCTGLPREVRVVTKREINGATLSDTISRSHDHIEFKPGQHGYVLIDYDTKGMPPDVAARLDRTGGFWQTLLSIVPELNSTARVSRASTSAGLYHTGTGSPIPGSNGIHMYLSVRDVSDSARFLRTLHDRLWLAGFVWFVVSRAGQMLERSIVDRMVGGPERLVFEGAPVLAEPLAQDDEVRRPRVVEANGWIRGPRAHR
jgi:hypothetical protein